MFLKWPEWLGDKVLWVAIAIGLSGGLLGAVGRERHEGRTPDPDWWINRLLVMPFLAIVAGAASVTVLSNMPKAVSTFVAAVLSLTAYDAVRMIETRSLKRAADLLGGARDLSEPDTMVEVAKGGGVVKVEHPGAPSDVGRALRKAHHAPVHDNPDLSALLKRLDVEGEQDDI